MPKKYSRSKSRGGSKVAVGGNRQQRRRSKATSVRRKPNVKKSIAAYRKRAVSFAPKQLVHGRNTSSLPVRANAPRGRPAVRMRPNVPTNIFVNYDKNVLDKRMLLDRHLAEGNLDPDDIEGLRDSDNDEDLLGTDIFKKYLDAAGGPLFKAETDMLRKHQESLRLSNQNKALNAERCRVCLDSELDIGPVKVERNDFPKHNNYNNIPSHPFRCLFTGTTGSGKTTNMIQLLIQPQYLKDYFDQIYIFSPNCKTEIEFEEIQKKNRGDVVMTEDFDEVNVNNIFQKMIRNAKKALLNIGKNYNHARRSTATAHYIKRAKSGTRSQLRYKSIGMPTGVQNKFKEAMKTKAENMDRKLKTTNTTHKRKKSSSSKSKKKNKKRKK